MMFEASPIGENVIRIYTLHIDLYVFMFLFFLFNPLAYMICDKTLCQYVFELEANQRLIVMNKYINKTP